MKSRRGWWPELKDKIGGADVVVEIVDARDVAGTRLPLAERWAGSNRLLLVANKCDLLPGGAPDRKLPHRGVWLSAKNAGTAERRALVEAIMGRARSRPVRALLIGYPNVGKSSIINMLAGRKAARVSPVAGTTRDIQWVRIGDELLVSDYRGVYPAREDKGDLVRKGALNVQADAETHAYKFAERALSNERLKGWLEKRYDVDLSGAEGAEDVLIAIAERRKWFLKGGEPNVAEAARSLVRAMAEAPEI